WVDSILEALREHGHF
ncbi:hypothetical protein CISIN_1g0221281mg, partial [Citrus sinensis]